MAKPKQGWLRSLFDRVASGDQLQTEVGGLPLPQELIDLIREGHWPRNRTEFLSQEFGTPPISADCIKRFAENESVICLQQPLFFTAAQLHAGSENLFWDMPETRSHEIELAKSIVIGDFGMGSDAPLILDYRTDKCSPSVWRLNYSSLPNPEPSGRYVSNNHWVMVAASFGGFVEFLDLWNVRFDLHSGK